jgi:hypothetical protein
MKMSARHDFRQFRAVHYGHSPDLFRLRFEGNPKSACFSVSALM